MLKEIFSLHKAWYIIVFLIALFPSLPRVLESCLMILLFIISFIIFKKKNLKITFHQIKTVLILSSLFFLYLFSLLYSSDFNRAINLLTKALQLLVFSLIYGVFSNDLLSNINFRRLLEVYVYSTIITLIIVHLYLKANVPLNISKWEYRQAFEQVTSVHGTYFSLWIGFAILALLFLILNKTYKIFRTHLIIYLISITYLFFWIIKIEARVSIISTIICSLLLFFFYKKKNKKILILSTVLIFSCVFYIGFKKNYFKKFEVLINYQFDLPKGDYNIHFNSITSEQIRNGIYYCSYIIFKDNLILGCGVGDVKNKLNNCYGKNIDSNLYQMNYYNAHNQLVHIVLSNGILGLIIYILSIFYMLKMAIKSKKYLYFTFLLYVGICCLTENILSRHDGVLFFGFFNAILFYYKPNLKE